MPGCARDTNPGRPYFTLPITSISKDSGLVTVQWIAMPKEWLDCYAQPPSPGTSHAAYLINILVRREGAAHTKVTVNSFMTRTDMPVGLSECYSTGFFENLFFSTIGNRSLCPPVREKGGVVNAPRTAIAQNPRTRFQESRVASRTSFHS